MRLTISNLRKDDFGYYHCVARNELNATMVNFEIARRFRFSLDSPSILMN